MDALAVIAAAPTYHGAVSRLVADGLSPVEARAELERAAVGLWCAEAWALLVDEMLSLRRAQEREQAIAETMALVRGSLPDLAEYSVVDGAARYTCPGGPDALSQRAGSIARLGDTAAKLLTTESRIRDAIERRQTALQRRLLALQVSARTDPTLTIRELAALAVRDGSIETARVLLGHVERRETIAAPGALTAAAERIVEDPISAAADRVSRAWVGLHLARLQGAQEIAAEEELDRASTAHRAAIASGESDAPEDVREALAILVDDHARGRL